MCRRRPRSEVFVARLGVRMNETVRNREDLSLLFELMGVPFATVRNLMEDEGR